LFTSITDDYVFCCNGSKVVGKGKIKIKGGDITLEHNGLDKRVLARVSTVAKTGTASLQMPPGTLKCVITDRNTSNNSCNCSLP
jgi:hypothetical protein